MRHLEIPLQMSSLRIQGQHAAGIEILSRTAVSKVLVRGLADGYKHETIRGIERHRYPTARPTPVLPPIRSPSSEVRFSRLRHRVETPLFFSGAQIKGANVAGDTVPALLSRARSQ